MATAQGRCVGDVGGQRVQGEGRAVRARCVPGQDCDLYPGPMAASVAPQPGGAWSA